MNLKCNECGKKLEFGKDGICDCGKELCFDCYSKNNHREHMSLIDNKANSPDAKKQAPVISVLGEVPNENL